MDYSVEALAGGLKQARRSKRLSQRDLSAKIGLPQSHISKIESGQVDFKASSLIELARALDLEVMLVPRNLVPAVTAFSSKTEGRQEIVTSGEGTPEADVRESLAHLRRITERATRSLGALPELTRMTAAVRDLERLRFAGAQAAQIREVLKSVEVPRDALRDALRTHAKVNEVVNTPWFKESLRQITHAADDFKNIRNALAHGAAVSRVKTLPAYRLSDGEDDA